MDLSKILSIAGRSGLHKVVSQGKNSVIVESLADRKRFPAFGHEKMSTLEEISLFTTGEDRPLKEVFRAIHEKLEGKAAPDMKSDDAALKKFFLGMVPDYDTERVYVSDMRKIVNWYNQLVGENLLDFTEEKAEESADGTPAEPSEPSPAEPESK